MAPYAARSSAAGSRAAAASSAAPLPATAGLTLAHAISGGKGNVTTISSSGPTVERIHEGKKPTEAPALLELHMPGGGLLGLRAAREGDDGAAQ